MLSKCLLIKANWLRRLSGVILDMPRCPELEELPDSLLLALLTQCRALLWGFCILEAGEEGNAQLLRGLLRAECQAGAGQAFCQERPPCPHSHNPVCSSSPVAPEPRPWKERGSNGSSCENPSNPDKNSRGLPYPLFPVGLDMFVCSALKLRAVPQTLN